MMRLTKQVKKLLAFRNRLKRREKIVILAGLLVAAGIFSYYIFDRYRAMNTVMIDRIRTRAVYLTKQFGRIAEKSQVQVRLEAARAELQKLEGGLLPGGKPPVAAAELQRSLKEMAMAAGVDIRSERPMSPVEMNVYLGIPVEISFIASTAKLKEMLFKIETSPLILAVTDMKVSVTNAMNPTDVHAFLVVRGLITKEPGTEVHAGKSDKEAVKEEDMETFRREQDKNPFAVDRRRR